MSGAVGKIKDTESVFNGAKVQTSGGYTGGEMIGVTLLEEVRRGNSVNDQVLIYDVGFNFPIPVEHFDPDMSTRIDVSLQLDELHNIVAFSECHCGEDVLGQAYPGYVPCLWCSANAALYAATGNDMYAERNKGKITPLGAKMSGPVVRPPKGTKQK